MSSATLQALLGAAAFALVLGAVGPTLDAEPYPAAPDVDHVALAVAASQADDLAECRRQHGEASVVYLPDGQHRCTTKHGRRLPQPGTR